MVLSTQINNIRTQVQDSIMLLSEQDLQKVSVFVNNLVQEEAGNPFKAMSKEQILADIRESKEEYKQGLGEDAFLSLDELESELGL